MTTMRMQVMAIGLVLLGLTMSGCGDDTNAAHDSGSTGGEGGGGGDQQSVLGTKQKGGCGSSEAFADECKAEGGILADHCQDAVCAGDGYMATCYAPPPAPGAGQFSCDGVINCDEGKLCVVENPIADGCFSHACEAAPADCAATPTCACLEANYDGSVLHCEEDAAGNVRVELTPPFWSK